MRGQPCSSKYCVAKTKQKHFKNGLLCLLRCNGVYTLRFKFIQGKVLLFPLCWTIILKGAIPGLTKKQGQ